MDDELQNLEAELKRLRPRALSAELQARVAGELAPRRRANWVWSALPIAAALTLLFAVQFRNAPPVKTEAAPPVATSSETVATTPAPTEPLAQAEPVPAYKPVAVENALYDSQDDGIITLANGNQARRVRSSYVDTITWRNPQTNASLRWSVPRNEVRVVPVSFQ